MARAPLQSLTEPMFYVLLCLRQECCGMDLMEQIRTRTEGAVNIGPGTVYHLLDQFTEAELIRLTKVEGRRKSYVITNLGLDALEQEYQRICRQARDYRAFGKEETL